MSRGPSGRIVAELDPELKRSLHAELAREALTFKDWLTREARRYLAERRQPRLFVAEPPGQRHGVGVPPRGRS